MSLSACRLIQVGSSLSADGVQPELQDLNIPECALELARIQANALIEDVLVARSGIGPAIRVSLQQSRRTFRIAMRHTIGTQGGEDQILSRSESGVIDQACHWPRKFRTKPIRAEKYESAIDHEPKFLKSPLFVEVEEPWLADSLEPKQVE